jgi:hypothetical protein
MIGRVIKRAKNDDGPVNELARCIPTPYLIPEHMRWSSLTETLKHSERT